MSNEEINAKKNKLLDSIFEDLEGDKTIENLELKTDNMYAEYMRNIGLYKKELAKLERQIQLRDHHLKKYRQQESQFVKEGLFEEKCGEIVVNYQAVEKLMINNKTLVDSIKKIAGGYDKLLKNYDELQNEYSEAKKVFETEMHQPFMKWVSDMKSKDEALRERGEH